VLDSWHQADVGEWAGGWEPPPLSSFLINDVKPLSRRATAGFLARTRDPRNTLRINERFLGDLQAHLEKAEAAEATH